MHTILRLCPEQIKKIVFNLHLSSILWEFTWISDSKFCIWIFYRSHQIIHLSKLNKYNGFLLKGSFTNSSLISSSLAEIFELIDSDSVIFYCLFLSSLLLLLFSLTVFLVFNFDTLCCGSSSSLKSSIERLLLNNIIFSSSSQELKI